MGAQTAHSLEEYLRTSFEGVDREYRDGELVERSLPDPTHGLTQMNLGAFFVALRKTTSIFPCSETRVRLREGLILIPDVCVFLETPQKRLPDTPPLIAIEILSPDDRHLAVRSKLEEYRAWGVPHVWLIDPYLRRLYKCDEGLVEVPSLALPEFGVELTPADLFE
ncbi:MAG TPA: Uma2 family endonuclease [Bryobacteraceae bacterium]|jgi:Uma2 family endonuclease|nr:Uma2 family endonuclease [Bryobacteraceae bacterium]